MRSLTKPCYVMADRALWWFNTFKMGFSDEFTAWARTQPGVHFNKKFACYYVPVELTNEAIEQATACGFDVQDHRPVSGQNPVVQLNLDPRAHSYQREHALLAARNRRWIEASEMGLGKSPIVLLAAMLRQHKRGIVVDSAGHRLGWYRAANRRRPTATGEFEMWWPNHPDIEVIEDGAAAATSTAPIRIVSYQLLHKLNLDLPVDFVFFDEGHMLMNPATQWSKAANTLVNEKWLDAWVVLMTGTLIPNNIMTLYPILNLMWPGRFGSKWDFGDAYGIAITNDYGKKEYDPELVNEARMPELRRRLGFMSARTVKTEVAHLLPKFITRVRWVGEDRVAAAVEWVREMRANGVQHLTVLTHLRATAAAIEAECSKFTVNSILLTGDTNPAERFRKIENHKLRPSGVLVATLHAVTTGLDLTFAPTVGFAEIYTQPMAMIQTLGRFHRMTSVMNADITVFAKQGGDPEAESLLRKIEAINQVLKKGSAESGLEGLNDDLKNMGLSNEQVNDMLRGAATEFIPDEF